MKAMWMRMLFVGTLVVSCTTMALHAQDVSAPPPQQAALPPQQLDNLVAPVALYPDPLLGQVLVASTYPVELMEAQQWLQANSRLTGQQLMDAARQQNWDASIQALVAMPDVLGRLTQNIRWTTDLGNAFLAQEADVMAAVQRMRARAQANGRLQSNAQETVTTQYDGGQPAIEIQPADPQMLYVPAYNPNYVWGLPAYGYYPPLYYPDYGFGFGPGINIGFAFGGWGGWGFGGWGWGWGPNWFGRTVFVNNSFFNRYGYHHGHGFAGGYGGRAAWVHDPGHRLGVVYPNSGLSNRFAAASQASRIAAGRSGNWHSFGGGNPGNRNSFTGVQPRAGGRSFQSSQGPANSQRFQGRQNYNQAPGQQRFQGGAQQRFQGQAQPHAQQHFQGGAQQRQAPAQQRFQAPAQQRFQGGAQQRQAPAQQRFQAPAQQHFQGGAQQRYQAPAQQHFQAPAQQHSGGGNPNRGGGGHGEGRNRR